MAATVGQSTLTPGATVTVRVRLTQYETIPIEGAKVRALVRFPDNSEITFYLNPIAEGVYETLFTANLTGTYTIRITAEGHTLRGVPFTREAVRTAIVWPGGDREPLSSDGDCWCRLIRCSLESKALDPEVLKRLGVNVEGILRCCPPEEPEGQVKRRAHVTGRKTAAAATPPASKKARKKTSTKRRQTRR
jgi:hypothetical protein